MSELSKQICESAGISPKCDVVECDYEWEPQGKCDGTTCEKCDHEGKTTVVIYPDFEENNNNFVKLLEVAWEFKLDFCNLANGSNECSFRQKFLEEVILHALESNRELTEEGKNQFKQALQQQEWEFSNDS